MPRSYDRKSRRQFQHPLPPSAPDENAGPVIRQDRITWSPFPLRILRPGRAKRRQYPILPTGFIRVHSRVFRGFPRPRFPGNVIRQRVPGAGESSFQIVLRRPQRKCREPFPFQLLRGHWQRTKLPEAADVVRIAESRFQKGQQCYPLGKTHRTRTIPGEVLEPLARVRQHIIASWLRLLPPPFVGAWPHKIRKRHPQNVFPTGEEGPQPVNPCQGPNVRPDETCDDSVRPPDCAPEKSR